MSKDKIFKTMLSRGVTILTTRTKDWSDKLIAANNKIEGLIIFDNFNMSDEGRSRKKVCIAESSEYAEAIVTAVNSTYGSMIDPLAVPDLLDCLQKMWDIAKDRWRSLPATSHEKNVLSSTKAALEKAKLK